MYCGTDPRLITTQVPLGVHLDPSKNQYYSYEAEGCKDLGTMGFVLVAGGLGERLGYNDVKIGLPVEVYTTHTLHHVH